MNKYFVITIIVLSLLLLGIGKLYLKEKADRKRMTENFEQLQNDNQLLNLTYSKKEQYFNEKLDSVLKANKIKPKQVITATLIKTEYIDTGGVKIVYREPEKQIDSRYNIEVSYSDVCWGMEGVITSTDPETKLEITQRTANNNVQAVIIRKRFLGFLWWKKNQELKVFSDCGEANVTQINYSK